VDKKTNHMKKVFSLAITALVAFAATAQPFEGTIEFKKRTATDTTNYVYYVKGEKIKIDEIGSKSKKVEGSFIINTSASTMQFISHERKLYGDQPSGSTNKPAGKCEVTWTKNTKTIQNMKCTEVVVKNKDENTTITYWLAKGKFDFFDVMLRVLNRKDKFSTYYLEIPNAKGMMPVLAIMTSADGKEKERLETTKVEKKPQDAKTFEIPTGYMKFEK
jgi:hypothetical protein